MAFGGFGVIRGTTCALVMGFGISASAQHGGHDDHGYAILHTAPMSEVWAAFVESCSNFVTDPEAYVDAHTRPDPNAEQVAHQTPDGGIVMASRTTHSGVWHMMELVDTSVRRRAVCQVQSEPEVESFFDHTRYHQLMTDGDAELRAMVAEAGGSIVGGSMPLLDIGASHDFPEIPGAEFYTYAYAIELDFAGETRLVHAGINGGALSMSGEYQVTQASERGLPSSVADTSPVDSAEASAMTPEMTAVRAFARECLRNYRTPGLAIAALEAQGLRAVPGMDAGSWELSVPGLQGLVTVGDALYCSIQSPDIPLDEAATLGWELANELFPDLVEKGSPEGANGLCDGLTIVAPRQMIWVSYAQAGNSGACIEDGSSAVIIR